MKKIAITGFIVALCLLIIPLPFINNKKSGERDAAETSASATAAYAESAAPAAGGAPTFRIKIGDTVENIPADEYITGVVAAEMPASYNIEALKAQSVAAYSFALYRRGARQNEEYDLTDSYKTDQSYIKPDALKEKWGDSYEERIAVIKQAVSAVSGQYLSYGGQPALALYHSLSPGKTNACRDVFGGDIPYLISVESPADKLSPDYRSVFSFAADELKAKLCEIKEAESGENLFSGEVITENGYVKEIKYCDTPVSGSAVAALLGLPSANFTVAFSEGAYTFTCLGHGHGVGMSQYGAGQLAATGAQYTEILYHYYPGTKINKP